MDLPYKLPTSAMKFITTWPITQTRYKYVLAKMHRYWKEIQCLKLEIEYLKRELDKHR